VRAVLVAACGEKSSGDVGAGSGERRDKRLGKAARHNVGHWAAAGEGVC
jgi:hypothetical protein